jgi:hypothetical protein
VTAPLRIANCSGFYGDRLAAAAEMVEGGPIDVLTGDYLAELTMAILARQRMKDPGAGYVPTFLTQMEQVLAACLERGIKVVANAGGLDPHGLAAAVGDLAGRLGVDPVIAVVDGDDLMGRLDEVPLAHVNTGDPPSSRGLAPLTANAYLGGWGITAALDRGADVVVTGRVADAALVSGPAAWRHGWAREDWDRLAGAVVAGHVIECGAQATGGNYSFFAEVPGLSHPGFPIAEVHEDGSSIITKHPGTGGLVSVGTVTAQLLYEIAGPAYPTPDVTARFDTVRLAQEGPDRVRIAGARGDPPPDTARVAATCFGGYRNSMTFVIAGLDVEEKAALAAETLWATVGGRDRFAATDVRLVRTDKADPPTNEEACAALTITVMDPDPAKVGRAFSSAAVEQALAGYPGLTFAAPPGRESPFVVFWPARIPAEVAPSRVTIGGDAVEVPPTPGVPFDPGEPEDGGAGAAFVEEPWEMVPLGRVAGARSGDKGGDANLGVWVRDPGGFEWLDAMLTTERLRALLPDIAGYPIRRYRFPDLRAVNFVVEGLLGEGAASSTRPDPQAKTLGEYLRARVVQVPARLLER